MIEAVFICVNVALKFVMTREQIAKASSWGHWNRRKKGGNLFRTRTCGGFCQKVVTSASACVFNVASR
eukprot:8340182-Ditylum_brightwellii.AAC.1